MISLVNPMMPFCESDVSYCWLGHSGPYINQLLTSQIVLFMMVTTVLILNLTARQELREV